MALKKTKAKSRNSLFVQKWNNVYSADFSNTSKRGQKFAKRERHQHSTQRDYHKLDYE